VGAGDTATALALQLRPEGATLEQTLVALWRTNPRAFGQGSLNQLLQGATLRVPSKAEVLRTTPEQAHALVVEQVDNFQAYARQQSRPAASTAASATTAPALDTVAWRRALAEAQALKEALEKQSRETQTRLVQLEKNIQTLQGLQANASPPAPAPASTAAPAASALAATASVSSVASEPAAAEAAASEASGPESAASQAGAGASEPTAIASETSAAPSNQAAPTLPALPLWVWWTGVGAVVVLMWALTRRRTDTAAHPRPTPEIPPQMARINLDLESPPSSAGQDPRP
jgi:pilus assembly protein FimV